MKELFEALLAALRRGETAALCTILGACGSAPRGAGAKMAVFADGSTIGTVGGGAVELRTIEMANEASSTDILRPLMDKAPVGHTAVQLRSLSVLQRSQSMAIPSFVRRTQPDGAASAHRPHPMHLERS